MRMTASWFGSLDPTAYKVVARLIRATESGLPSDRHADRIECAAVLRAVKVWPGKGRARGKVGATANLDSSCARRLCNTAGRGEETGFQVEQRNRSRKQEREIAALKPLDNKDPIQGASGANREAESTDAPGRGGLLRSSDEAGVMPVERRERAIAIWLGSTGNGRNPMFNRRRQPSRGGTSRMTRECQVRFCEGLGVKFPGPTRHELTQRIIRGESV